METLGEMLRRLRGKRSLREAAKLTGLSYSYISSLEKGEHPKTKSPIKASPETLKLFSKAYNYDYQELMKVAGYLDGESDVNEQVKEAPVLYNTRNYDEFMKDIVKQYPDVDLNDPDVRRKLMKAIDLVLDDYEKK